MKLNKAFIMMAAALAGVLASCSDEGDWTAGTPLDDGGLAYTFQSASGSYSYGPYDEIADIEVTVVRNTTSGNVSLPITAVFSDTDKLNGPSSVEFNDGENTSVYTITAGTFDIGESATATLTIDPKSIGITPVEYPDSALLKGGVPTDSVKFYEQETAYNTYTAQLETYKLSCTITVAKDYSWTSLGMGAYADYDWWLDDDNYETSVEFFQCDQDPNRFRITNPYNWIDYKDDYLVFYILQPGDVIGSTTVTRSDLVRFPDCLIDYSSSYDDDVYILWPGRFTANTTEDSWSRNYVKSWQDNGLPAVIQLAPYYYMFNNGGWNYSVYDDVINIIFPGVTVADYSASISYTGTYIDTDDVMYAQVTTGLGSDVAYARIAIVSGEDNISDAYYGILYETLDYTEITEGGDYNIEIPEDNLTTGYATVAIVTFDSDGNVQEYDYDSFIFHSRETIVDWDLTQSLVGTWTYSLFFSGYDTGLTLTNDGAGTYTISDWGYGVDFEFTYDEDENLAYVPAQYTGYTDRTYGKVYVSDELTYDAAYYADYYAYLDAFYNYEYYGYESFEEAYADLYADLYDYYFEYFYEDLKDEEYPSYYDSTSGTFKFDLVYYCAAGIFGYGYEAFTITDYATASASASAKSALKFSGKSYASKSVSVPAPPAPSADLLKTRKSSGISSAAQVLKVSSPSFKLLPMPSSVSDRSTGTGTKKSRRMEGAPEHFRLK